MSSYILLDYIQSTGTQYIDLEFVPTGNTRFEVRWNNLRDCAVGITDMTLFGVRQNFNLNQFQLTDYSTSNPPTSGTFGYSLDELEWYSLNYEGNETITTKFIGNTLSTGTGLTHIISNQTKTLGGNLYLFALNNNGSIIEKSSFRLYYAKFYEGTELIRDLIPVKEVETNKIGLLDLVNMYFYENNGTGTFNYSGGTTPSIISNFIDPIYDRTLLDIQRLEELKQKFYDGTITPEEKTEWNGGIKGALNKNDWIRILHNQQFLAEYYELPFIYQEENNEFPRVVNYEVLLRNMKTIKDGCQHYVDTPNVPDHELNYYEKWNDIEKILFDINVIRLENIGAKYFTGTELYGNNNILI